MHVCYKIVPNLKLIQITSNKEHFIDEVRKRNLKSNKVFAPD